MSLATEVPVDLSEKTPRNESAPVQDSRNLLGKDSPGVRRIEIISSHFRMADRVFLFLAIFLIAYVYGLDGTVRYTYQVCTRHPVEQTSIGVINLILL